MNLKIFLLTAALIFSLSAQSRDTIDLAGSWQYRLRDIPDSLKAITTEFGSLILPGTLDSNGVGTPVAPSSSTDNLARRFSYTGRAVYLRTVVIPEETEGKRITLNIERTRPVSIKVDGIDAGTSSVISASQIYDLTSFLTPGEHLLEITVDNGNAIPPAVRNSSHACTEATQTNWNGIVGQIFLEVSDPVNISSLHISSDTSGNAFIIEGTVARTGYDGSLTVTASADGVTATDRIHSGQPDDFSITLPLGPDTELWSETNPRLYDIIITITDEEGNARDQLMRRSGIRDFSTSGRNFTINGTPTFLRGRHDACVWPLTAYPPTDIDSWRKYFRILKDYGLNHVRFHSWCPPEACFAAADEMGVYLQPELSIWGEIDRDQAPLLEFLDSDMESIISQYGHHPSFVMFAIGNELWGDTSIMKDYIDKARRLQHGLLATYGSNLYLGHLGHVEGEDYLTTARVGDGEGFSTHTRASFSFADADNGGIINSTSPNTVMNFANAISKSPVPVIGHETGQYQSYPDYSSIGKYTGVLHPDNLVEFKRRAEESGTLRKSDRFAKASGEWASKLYKMDMEMNLRTPGMGGFQLLDIQDYPGQGTALVGILDPFMDSKGVITPEEWRESCNDLTVLAELPRFTFTAGEELTFNIVTADFSGQPAEREILTWELPFSAGTDTVISQTGVTRLQNISLTLPDVKEPVKMSLNLSLRDQETGTIRAKNTYDIWIYPQRINAVKGVAVTTDINEALELLSHGKRVILSPDSATVAATTLNPLFQTDYWNYSMFRSICRNVGRTPSPGTLGLLIDASHPALRKFPTDNNTDRQWFEIIKHSRPLIVDRLPASIDPVIEPIDNPDRAYRLATLLEFNVGKGKLLIAMTDLDAIGTTPEGRWFRHSLESYVASKDFRPTVSLTPGQITDLLTRPTPARIMKEYEADKNI